MEFPIIDLTAAPVPDDDFIMIPREVWDHHFADAMKDFPDRYNSRAKLMLALEEHSHGGKNISSKKS